MMTRFIATEIDLPSTPRALHQAIEAALHQYGQPLRWAVTQVDWEQRKVQLEAVVTVAELDEDIPDAAGIGSPK